MFVPPRVYTPLDSKSYRLGTDPAMAAILTPDTPGSVIGRIQHDIEAGDSAAAERALTAARENTANRFRSLEADVNRLGYDLLGSGRVPQAIQVFSPEHARLPALREHVRQPGRDAAHGRLPRRRGRHVPPCARGGARLPAVDAGAATPRRVALELRATAAPRAQAVSLRSACAHAC